MGLQPILRVIWAPKGEHPTTTAVARPRYEWLYVVAFVHPEGGTASFALVPAINTVIFPTLPHTFAEERGVGIRKRILLVIDQAAWHGTEVMNVTERMTLIFLPPSSLELRPAEHLSELADELLANRCFEGLADLEEVLSFPGPKLDRAALFASVMLILTLGGIRATLVREFTLPHEHRHRAWYLCRQSCRRTFRGSGRSSNLPCAGYLGR